MNPSTINPDEMLKSMAAQAVKQHEQIRTTIRDITLKVNRPGFVGGHLV